MWKEISSLSHQDTEWSPRGEVKVRGTRNWNYRTFYWSRGSEVSNEIKWSTVPVLISLIFWSNTTLRMSLTTTDLCYSMLERKMPGIRYHCWSSQNWLKLPQGFGLKLYHISSTSLSWLLKRRDLSPRRILVSVLILIQSVPAIRVRLNCRLSYSNVIALSSRLMSVTVAPLK